MTTSMSAWLQGKFDEHPALSPARGFCIGTSDYSDRVLKWPKIKQITSTGQVTNQLQSQSLTIQLANHDGKFNDFYKLSYTTANKECSLRMGLYDKYTSVSLDSFEDGLGSWTIQGSIYTPVGDPEGGVAGGIGFESPFVFFSATFSNELTDEDLFVLHCCMTKTFSLVSSSQVLTTCKCRTVIQASHSNLYPTARTQFYIDSTSKMCGGQSSYSYDNDIHYFGNSGTAYSTYSADTGWEQFSDTIILGPGAHTVKIGIMLTMAANDTVPAGPKDMTAYVDDVFIYARTPVEQIPIFTGNLQSVRYPSEGVCELKIRDKLFTLSGREIGNQDSAETFSCSPSDIAWYLCTSWGGMSTVTSTSNPDIDYSAWQTWAAQFSLDSVSVQARYDGQKVLEAMQNLCRMADSSIHVSGDGKLRFYRFSEPSSLGSYFDKTNLKSMQLDVEALTVINKQTVNFGYDPTSRIFTSTVNMQSSTSINSYGLREDTIEDDTCWFGSSASALNLAQRRVMRYQYPPITFKNVGGLRAIYREIGEACFITNSFYDITSNSGWRVVSKEIDMNEGTITWGLDEAGANLAFYLDITSLDGEELLL